MTNPKPKKKSGKPQRADVALTPELAFALGDMILAGTSLHPKNKRVILTSIGENGDEVKQELSCFTLDSWLQRGNVIPGSGQTLREFLDKKRAIKRRRDREAAQAEIIADAERQLREIAKISLVPRPDVERYYKIDEETGEKILKGEKVLEHGTSPKMIEAVTRAASFSLERLDPDRYSAKLETKNSHLIFSLADIQRIREERNQKTINQPDA